MGSHESSYMISMARFCPAGRRRTRPSAEPSRGAGPSRATCRRIAILRRPQPGSSTCPAGEPSRGAGAESRAASASSAIQHGRCEGLLKYLGEEGEAAARCWPRRRSARPSTCQRPAAGCWLSGHRNFIYHAPPAGNDEEPSRPPHQGALALLPESSRERSAILGSRMHAGIWEYDEVFIAPRHGFATARKTITSAASRFALHGRHPEPCTDPGALGALDDPWIPGALYSGYDWAANKALLPLLPLWAGHVGFHGFGQPASVERPGGREIFRGQVRMPETRPHSGHDAALIIGQARPS